MTNKDFSPMYSGMYVEKILERVNAMSIRIDAGTVLVQEVAGLNLMFQNKCDIDFTTRLPSLELLEGSAIYLGEVALTDSDKLVVNYKIRIPHDEELEWYDKQNLV